MALTVAAVVTTSSIIVTLLTFLAVFESRIANAALRFFRRAPASANSVCGVVLRIRSIKLLQEGIPLASDTARVSSQA